MSSTARLLAVLAGGLGVAYAGVAEYGFVYEDARAIQHGSGAFRFGPRGLTSWLWLADPRASHALSVGLHVLVGVLTGALGWRLGLSRPAAVVAAGVLLLHPMAVESAVYLSSRAELIAAIGVLGACLVATGPWRYWLAIPLCLAVGVLGKESAVIGIGLVTLVWAHRWPSRWTFGLVVLGALAWVPLGVWRLGSLTAVAHIDGGQHTTLGWEWWVLAQSTAVFRLAVLSVVSWLPVGHTIDFDYDAVHPLARVAAFVLLGLVPLVLWLHRALVPRLVRWACAACIVALIPRMVIQTPRSYLAEHQFYVPLIFVAIAMAAVADVAPWRRWQWRRWSVDRAEAVALIVLLCLTWQTRVAVQPCTSDLGLWRNAALMAPTKPRPVANYAVALLVAGNRTAGEAMLDYVATIADDPHVTPWDRQEALEVVQINRRALRDFDARVAQRVEIAP